MGLLVKGWLPAFSKISLNLILNYFIGLILVVFHTVLYIAQSSVQAEIWQLISDVGGDVDDAAATFFHL